MSDEAVSNICMTVIVVAFIIAMVYFARGDK